MDDIQNPNYIIEYYEAIDNNEIVVSKKIKKLYQKLVDDIRSPKGNWIYDHEKANLPIEFIEEFIRINHGENTGQKVNLLLWQKAFVASVFGFVDKDTGYRRYRQVFLLCSRKQGKTAICTGIMLYCLFEEMGAQCIAAANTLDQAKKVVFEEVQSIIKQCPSLAKLIKKRKDDLYYADGLSKIFAVTNSPNTQDGLNASYCQFEEAHSQKNRELYDVIYQSMSTRKQPLMVVATTNGYIRGGCFDMLYDHFDHVLSGQYESDNSIGFFYELDDPKEVDDESCWIKCNPSLGTVKLYSFVKEIYEQSKHDPSILRTCYTKDFNIPMDENSSLDRLAPPDIILACRGKVDLEEFRESYMFQGLDLSYSGDLTCLTVLLQKKGSEMLYIHQDYWLPELTFEDHCRQTEAYRAWARDGYLHLCKNESKISLEDIESKILEYRTEYDIINLGLGYDRARSDFLIPRLEKKGVRCTPIGQGYTISNSMQILRNLIYEQKIRYSNPMTGWCLSNCLIGIDKHNNWSPEKLRTAMRIDGVSSLLDALFMYIKNQNLFLNRIK